MDRFICDDFSYDADVAGLNSLIDDRFWVKIGSWDKIWWGCVISSRRGFRNIIRVGVLGWRGPIIRGVGSGDEQALVMDISDVVGVSIFRMGLRCCEVGLEV
jgi:hypothetical protein